MGCCPSTAAQFLRCIYAQKERAHRNGTPCATAVSSNTLLGDEMTVSFRDAKVNTWPTYTIYMLCDVPNLLVRLRIAISEQTFARNHAVHYRDLSHTHDGVRTTHTWNLRRRARCHLPSAVTAIWISTQPQTHQGIRTIPATVRTLTAPRHRLQHIRRDLHAGARHHGPKQRFSHDACVQKSAQQATTFLRITIETRTNAMKEEGTQPKK